MKRAFPASTVVVAPIAIGERNCEAALGRRWRWVREFAQKHNVPRLPGATPVFSADALLALLSTGDAGAEVATDHDDAPVTAAGVLMQLGRRVGESR